MDIGGSWGLTLSVGPVLPAVPELPPPPGVTRRRTRLTELVDVQGFDGPRCATELQSIAELRAQVDAYEMAVVKRLADQRPDLWDLTPDDPGGRAEGWTPARTFAGVTEFFTDELATILNITPARAETLANTSLVLMEQLPSIWEALADRRIDLLRAQAIAKILGWQRDHVAADIIAAVEAQALAWAIEGMSWRRLEERTAAALLELDAAAADRRRKEHEHRSDTRVRRRGNGMAEVVIDLPVEQATAAVAAVDAYARMWKADGDKRPIGQLRALVAADLLLRPWDIRRPPVTAHVTVIAPLGSLGGPAVSDVKECGSVDGHPITAAHLRALLFDLDAASPGGLQASADGTLDVSLVDPTTGQLRVTVTRAEPERLARRGCSAHPDNDCECSLVGQRPRVDRYEPTPAQRRWVTARDRGCRHPGCRRPAAFSDSTMSSRTPRATRPSAPTWLVARPSPTRGSLYRVTTRALLERQRRGRVLVSYRNKTYVAFASEDIRYYRLMEAWRDNDHIDFDFFDAHDLYVARDTSKPESIKARLRERMRNAKQFVLLGGPSAKTKGGDGKSFLAYEVQTMVSLDLPVVVANLDGDRNVDRSFIPTPLLDADYYTLSVSFQPAIIMYALNNYAPLYAASGKTGPHFYNDSHYKKLGL